MNSCWVFSLLTLYKQKELQVADSKKLEEAAARTATLEDQLKDTTNKLQQQVAYCETVEFVMEEMNQKLEAEGLK